MPRTSTPSTRPLKVASKGCSISGVADTTPGVALACFSTSRQSSSRPPKPCTTAWPFSPTILSNRSARTPFITLITITSAATPSITAVKLNAAATKMNPSPRCGSI